VKGDVPPQLKEVRLLSLDIGLLQAGASMKGEFENRLRQVIEEVQSSPKPIILFIDEAHTLIGAGGAAGTGDAANLLKPALARGNLRTIAATTWAEYKKYFEKDPALTRRIQVVQVHEPSEDKTILMMRGVASTLEAHHRVQILDEALEAAVRLSHRYIPARQLPDKAVSLMDTACARVAVSQHATPPEIEDAQRRIETLNTELEIIDREAAIGIEVEGRRKSVEEKLAAGKGKLAGLEPRWKAEQELVTKVLGLRAKLREGRSPVEGTSSDLEKKAEKTRKDEKQPALKAEERSALLEELKTLQGKLAAMQGETPLVLPTADGQAVAAVVQDWTGIPVGRMVKNEIESVLKLADTLDQRVIGQKHGLQMIAKRVQTSRAKLDNPNKPIGVFMLAGPSGVGKTETALALAESLYGGEQNVITINMSEYQEAHTVSTLKGAPPGYVGYGEGGVLTEAVRRRPYSVVLLDEVEKAHSDVHEIFFQVFDKGWMEDGEGRYIDFKNTIILLTTNAGSELITNMCKDPELLPDPEALARALREPLLKVFPPALLGRIVTIPYYPLSDQMLATIIRLQIGRIKRRIEENHGVEFGFTDEVVALVGKRCTELESGGRMIDAILTNTVLPRISEEFLKRMMAGEPVKSVALGVAGGDFAYNFS
jgi:type VI secretion system protein VasG